MSTTSRTKYDDILREIEILPRDEQVDVLFYLLDRLLPTGNHTRVTHSEVASANPEPLAEKRPRKRTLQRALGLLATDGPTPTDEDIEQWLDEHRQEKYG